MEICLACIPATVAVGAGYILYKVVPSIVDGIKSLFNGFFYKTFYVTISQNKIKFLHLVKFMGNFKDNSKAVLIAIDDKEYEVPLTEIKVTSDTVPEFSIKAHTDSNYCVTYIEISVYKKDLLVFTDEKKIEKVSNFVKDLHLKQKVSTLQKYDHSKPPESRSLIPLESKSFGTPIYPKLPHSSIHLRELNREKRKAHSFKERMDEFNNK